MQSVYHILDMKSLSRQSRSVLKTRLLCGLFQYGVVITLTCLVITLLLSDNCLLRLILYHPEGHVCFTFNILL